MQEKERQSLWGQPESLKGDEYKPKAGEQEKFEGEPRKREALPSSGEGKIERGISGKDNQSLRGNMGSAKGVYINKKGKPLGRKEIVGG